MIATTRLEVTPDEIKAAICAWFKARGVDVPPTARLVTQFGDSLPAVFVDMPCTLSDFKEEPRG